MVEFYTMSKNWKLDCFKEKTLPNLEEKELTQLAKDIVNNLVFTSNHINPNENDLIGNIFMPLLLGATSDMSQGQINDIGMIYEYYKNNSGGWAINGYPTFFSCRFISKHDAKIIWEKVAKIEELMKTI